MCYQIVELYSVCRCLYYQHAVDRCASYGRPGHGVEQRSIFVGYACSLHSSPSGQATSSSSYADSGYYSSISARSYSFDDWVENLYANNPSDLSILLVSYRLRRPGLLEPPS